MIISAVGDYTGDQNNGNIISVAKVEPMQDLIQNNIQIRDRQIEALSERLNQVTSQQEKAKILRELELVTGVKLLH